MKKISKQNFRSVKIKRMRMALFLSGLLLTAAWPEFLLAEGQSLSDGAVVSSSQQVINFTEEALVLPQAAQAQGNVVSYPYQKTFIISAYYSPLEGQAKYVTGSYESDKRLNGNGVHGADGSPVFPGMIAAPKGYAFGTKMEIPGIGIVSVHDRGGAIVHAGVRNQAYDRLDIWMGYGDDGLARALQWGRRTVDVKVYGIQPSLKEEVDLGVSVPFLSKSTSAASVRSEPDMFGSDLRLGSEGEEVFKLQEALKGLGYFTAVSTRQFDEATRDALMKFQQDVGIIDDESSFGAGYFGPQTRKFLQEKVKNPQSNLQASSENSEPVNASTGAFLRDLELGDRGNDVRQLQEELQKMNLLAVETSGYYGEVTRHAVFKLQQNLLLVGGHDSPGAGRLGKLTRTHLNTLIQQRTETEKLIADRKRSDEEINHQLAMK